MNKTDLYRQIDRFFEAGLTQQEEQVLFKILLKMEGQDRIADEALAVMLASRMQTRPETARKRLHIKRIVGMAASIALILGFGACFMRQPADSRTYAYVSGRKIHDRNEINNIVAIQLQDIGESTDIFSQTVATDLDDIREALISDDI